MFDLNWENNELTKPLPKTKNASYMCQLELPEPAVNCPKRVQGLTLRWSTGHWPVKITLWPVKGWKHGPLWPEETL